MEQRDDKASSCCTCLTMLGDSFARQQPNCRNRLLKEFFRNHESAEAGLAESIMGRPFRQSGLLAPQEPG